MRVAAGSLGPNWVKPRLSLFRSQSGSRMDVLSSLLESWIGFSMGDRTRALFGKPGHPCASLRRMRRIRDLNVAVGIPNVNADSFIEWPLMTECQNAACSGAGSLDSRFSIVCMSSTTAQICSGSGRFSAACKASVSGRFSISSSKEYSGCDFLRRRVMRAELMTIRVSQVESNDRPSNNGSRRYAFERPSCNASSASSWLRSMPNAMR